MSGQHSHAVPRADPLARRLPAGWKFVVTLLGVTAVALMPRERAIFLLVPAVLVLAAAAWGRVNAWQLVKRILMLEPFVAGVALMALFSPVGGGWWGFGFLAARCTVAMAILLTFAATTPMTDLLRVLRRWRVPWLLVTTVALMERYIWVLGDESARMRRARASRTFTRGRAHAWRSGSTIVAQLFVRASSRADRIYDAMRARGWGGGEGGAA